MSDHRHVFGRADVRYSDGTPIEGGRRCACGLEVVGDGPLSLNANFVRAGRDLNLALARAMADLGRRLEESRRRRLT